MWRKNKFTKNAALQVYSEGGISRCFFLVLAFFQKYLCYVRMGIIDKETFM
jgi:hypothetical protein